MDELQNKESSIHSFFKAFLVNFLSEIGDKTFIIAAVLSMKFDKKSVFVGAAGALIVMAFISCLLGYLFPQFLSVQYTKFLAGILFVFFGSTILWESYQNKQDENEKAEIDQEMKEIENKLLKGNEDQSIKDELNAGLQQATIATQADKKTKQVQQLSAKTIMWTTFAQVFLGEWGDKSQLGTVALAATGNGMFIFLGAATALSLTSFLAVTAGSYLSDKIPERVIGFFAGGLFMLFAICAFYESYNYVEPQNIE